MGLSRGILDHPHVFFLFFCAFRVASRTFYNVTNDASMSLFRLSALTFMEFTSGAGIMKKQINIKFHILNAPIALFVEEVSRAERIYFANLTIGECIFLN